MSFNFGNINPNNMKAQAAYKDGSGMGGGGMYFKQKGKRKEGPDEDLFEHKDDINDAEISFSEAIPEEAIPQDNIVNKFVNWFRIKEN